jgi:hypothetical protein
MVLARTRERLAMKIRSKLIVSPRRHFTKHLVDTFKKSPWKSNLNHESSSFLIRQLKNDIGFTLQQSHSNQCRSMNQCITAARQYNSWRGQLHTRAGELRLKTKFLVQRNNHWRRTNRIREPNQQSGRWWKSANGAPGTKNQSEGPARWPGKT